MKINTTRFGEIDVVEQSIFEFVVPILGYENEQKFALIEHSANSNLKWLQSMKTPSLAFVVTAAGFFGIDYTFELQDNVVEDLGIENVDDIMALNIVVIPHENPRNSTINLLAPLIMNVSNHKAGQIILSGSNFSVSHPLFENEGTELC